MNSFYDIINGETPVLVDFYADWCTPCRMLSPILSQVSKDMGDKVRVLKVNVDDNMAAAHAYKVQGVPTMILFHKGEVKWKGSGVMQADQIKRMIETNA